MCTQRVQTHTLVQHGSKSPNHIFTSRANMINTTLSWSGPVPPGHELSRSLDSPSVEGFGVGVGKPNAGLNTLRATSGRRTTRPRDVGAILYERKPRTSRTWTCAERADSSAPSEDAASCFSPPPADLSARQPRSSRPLAELLTSRWC